MAKTKIVSEISGIVFSLPWLVARDEGLFAEEGLEVEFRRPRNDLPSQRLAVDPKVVDTIGSHIVFEDSEVELYRGCEWGQVVRAQDSQRGGRIIGKRAAVGVQGIVVLPESGITHPQDLRNKTVGVNFHRGSHYITIQMLEGFLEDDEINVVHIGGNRWEALLNREVDAVTVMEPWLTIAEKHGALKIAEAHYVGSDIASDDVDPETFEKINSAIRKAVARINADKRKYVHYLLDEIDPRWKDTVTPDDFYLPRLRYVDPAPRPASSRRPTTGS
jgi:NitT/TauT family transport system substrate-binding protein